MSLSNPRPAFVFVHGAWHGAWSFEPVLPALAAAGCITLARDLLGHGLQARFPRSYRLRPLDAATFATETSPLAGITLADYADSVIESIDRLQAGGAGAVTLVGHSMGGVVLSAVAERVPEKLAQLVYLSAFMPASGVPAVAYIGAPENAGEMVGPQLCADPQLVGALRIDQHSDDTAYRARTRAAFFNDVDDATAEAALNLLTPDVPALPMVTPIATTRERWGAVPRHYLSCHRDQAIRPALQQRFIAEADAFAPNNRTTVHEMDAGHSPFLSQPAALAALLLRIVH